MTSQPPERIDHYVLGERLGQGGMGQVFRARDERLSRDVAIKVLALSRFEDEDAVLRLEREARALSRLDHPDICRVHGVGEHDGRPYIVMQLVAGQTLEARIRAAADGAARVMPGLPLRGTEATAQLPDAMDLDRLCAFFERVARAVHHAHQQGLVHRDLKPSNLMVTDDGAPVVLDFGLARDEADAHRLTRSAESVGTPQFMAPEQVDPRRGGVDARTDVHALGVTMYEAMTLWPAYSGATLHALSAAILDGRATPLRRRNASISPELAVVVETAMHKVPSQRYRSAAALADDLRAVARRAPILARRPSLARRLVLWARRNPVVATFVALLAASLLLATWALLDANRARGGMTRSLQQFDRLAILHRLQQAESAAAALFPAWPERAAGLRDWLERHGEPLAAEVDRLSAAVEELQADSAGSATSRFAELDPRSSAMLLTLLRDTLPRLRAFAQEEAGTVADVRRRLAWAERGAKDTLQHPGWAAARTAARGIAPYGGLDLSPQIDLIPIGADPRSGLLEFLHVPSHAPGAPPPSRDGQGRIQVREETGIVLVLVPGGDTTFGAQATDPSAANHDPQAEPDEAPVQVRLAPFFLAKHEMTQAQWRRLERASPSLFGPLVEPFTKQRADGSEVTFARFDGRHPVEQVSWRDCTEAMRKQGLALPTEAQWEHACRAGAVTPWSTGAQHESLQGHANLPDEIARLFSDGEYGFYCAWEDGFPVTAPVGSFLPNAFGLHDMRGNVYEWCRDAQLDVVRHARLQPLDGLRLEQSATPEELVNRAYRGGNYRRSPKEARSSNRMRMHMDAAGDEVGMRAARRIL